MTFWYSTVWFVSNEFARNRNIYVRPLIPALIFFALTVLNGCLIVPTPSHGGAGVITEESVESLKPEKSTRADMLHLLGDPAYGLEQDRFFVYWWKQTVAYFIPLVGGALRPPLRKPITYLWSSRLITTSDDSSSSRVCPIATC
jgi:hypothetical protein